MMRGEMKRVLGCMTLLLACSSGQSRSEPAPRDPEPAPSQEPAARTDEFVTGAELWAPDESAVLGIVVAMRQSPRGDASDFAMPTGESDPGDAYAVLFGARLIREGSAILSASLREQPRPFALERSAMPGPVQVWMFEDAALSRIERVEPCTACEPWQSPPARFVLIVPEGQALSATPAPGWTIAISP